jgi:hypothetical protein
LPRKSGTLAFEARFDDFLEAHLGAQVVGDLDSDAVPARDRSDHAHTRHAHVECNVVGQARDLGDAQTGFQADLVLRHHGACVDADDLDAQAEIREGLFEQGGPLAELLLVSGRVKRLRIFEEAQRRHLVGRQSERTLSWPPPRGRVPVDRDGSSRSVVDGPCRGRTR